MKETVLSQLAAVLLDTVLISLILRFLFYTVRIIVVLSSQGYSQMKYVNICKAPRIVLGI